MKIWRKGFVSGRLTLAVDFREHHSLLLIDTRELPSNLNSTSPYILSTSSKLIWQHYLEDIISHLLSLFCVLIFLSSVLTWVECASMSNASLALPPLLLIYHQKADRPNQSTKRIEKHTRLASWQPREGYESSTRDRSGCFPQTLSSGVWSNTNIDCWSILSLQSYFRRSLLESQACSSSVAAVYWGMKVNDIVLLL